jgi:hypothetical protein
MGWQLEIRNSKLETGVGRFVVPRSALEPMVGGRLNRKVAKVREGRMRARAAKVLSFAYLGDLPVKPNPHSEFRIRKHFPHGCCQLL